jgi:hypothetical protein
MRRLKEILTKWRLADRKIDAKWNPKRNLNKKIVLDSMLISIPLDKMHECLKALSSEMDPAEIRLIR